MIWMRSRLVILPFLFLFSLNAKGQTAENIKQLQQKLLSADSIVLISHVLTAGFAPKIVRDIDARDTKKRTVQNEIQHPQYLKNGKINSAIVKQRKVISKAEIAELSQIFRVEVVKETNLYKCDMPHHSIIIYKKGVQSYIDICFACKRIHTSNDIALAEADLTDNKWEKLKSFFKKFGLTYELLASSYQYF